MEEASTMANVSIFAPAVVVVRSPGGLGSGFFINKNGYLVTNFHVIQGQKHISVTRFKKSGAEFKRIIHKNVRIVALDPFHDLAVLQVESPLDTAFRPTVFGGDEEPAVGEKIFVIGNPLGLERSVTEGVISHTGRNFAGRLYLQVDASVNPGNSGGPLFNSRGQVIGVINMGVRAMQGLNFAIPVDHVKFVLDHIDAFAYDESNPLSGYVYSPPPAKPKKQPGTADGKK
jgi:serine protease Do